MVDDEDMKSIGLDLAAKQSNPTGLVVLTWCSMKSRIVYTDNEIITEIKNEKPDIVAIDAPFSLSKQSFRKHERKMLLHGFNLLPLNLKPMRILAKRCMRLRRKLKMYKTIEVFPRATEKVINMCKPKHLTKDEYDAYLSALTGLLYLKGMTMIFGNKRYGIVVPNVSNNFNRFLRKSFF